MGAFRVVPFCRLFLEAVQVANAPLTSSPAWVGLLLFGSVFGSVPTKSFSCAREVSWQTACTGAAVRLLLCRVPLGRSGVLWQAHALLFESFSVGSPQRGLKSYGMHVQGKPRVLQHALASLFDPFSVQCVAA